MLKRIRYLILSAIIFLTSCSQNLYQGFSNPNSDPALYQDAVNKMNAYNWDGALSDFNAMSPTYFSSRRVQFQFAQALAGKCGFDFNASLTNLSTINVVTKPLMLSLMQSYQNTTVNLYVTGMTQPVSAGSNTKASYCSWAQQVMDDIQTLYSPWNADETFFVWLYNMYKVGLILKAFADIDSDTVVDPTFNGCKTAVIPDFFMVQIVTGIALTLSLVGSVVGAPAGVAGFAAACGTFGIAMCAHTTPAQVIASVPDVKNMRGLMIYFNQVVTTLNGIGLIAAFNAGTSHASDPGPVTLWQCDGTMGNPIAGTLGCCP